MNKEYLIAQAGKFLKKRGLSIVEPGEIGEVEANRVEIIFLKSEALNPNAVVDPPDVRVWVDKQTGKVELIEQM